jgi:septum site-determining protein MinC
MAHNPKNNGIDATRVFELKAANFTLPIIRLLDANVEAVAAKVGAKVEQAPDFFHNTPVVIDLSALPEEAGTLEFPLLVGLLRGYGMIPFGVRGGNKEQNAAAEALELAILRDSYVRRDKTEDTVDLDEPEPLVEKLVAADPGKASPWQGQGQAQGETPAEERRQGAERRSAAGFITITRPVRSGQRIYASGGDLSIIAAVSSGAELMADGNIHVYGPLRGRALAGMNGNLEARIFCQDLQAELISIAGHYRISENIPEDMRGFPVQIFLDQKVLRIEKL